MGLGVWPALMGLALCIEVFLVWVLGVLLLILFIAFSLGLRGWNKGLGVEALRYGLGLGTQLRFFRLLGFLFALV